MVRVCVLLLVLFSWVVVVEDAISGSEGVLESTAEEVDELTLEGVFKAITQEADEISREYSRLRGWEDNSHLKPRIDALDKKLSEAVKKVFAAESDFEEVQKATSPFIQWRPWPTPIGQKERVQFQLNGREVVQINYKHRRLKEDRDLYLLENSFWKTESRGRRNPSMYAVIVGDGEAKLHPFREPHPKIERWLDTPPCFIDFVDVEGDKPGVMMLYGPAGSGQFATLRLFVFNEERAMWEPKGGQEFSPLQKFRYDEQERRFTYTTTGVGQDGRTIPKEVVLPIDDMIESIIEMSQHAD